MNIVWTNVNFDILPQKKPSTNGNNNQKKKKIPRRNASHVNNLYYIIFWLEHENETKTLLWKFSVNMK